MSKYPFFYLSIYAHHILSQMTGQSSYKQCKSLRVEMNVRDPKTHM